MIANLKRRNHYLPACYQMGFTNSTGQVWVKFAHKLKPELRNPKKVGAKRSLYIVKRDGMETDKVEDFFTDKVETPFAVLSQRIKEEANKFSRISANETTTLATFVASQAVRTLAHRKCIEEQAQAPVDTNTFVRAMGTKISTLLADWISNPPDFYFYTSLPYVEDRFITGDHPVVVIVPNDNPIWMPTDTPRLGITSLADILKNPQRKLISFSPYICLSVQGGGGGKPHLPPQTMEPPSSGPSTVWFAGRARFLFLLGTWNPLHETPLDKQPLRVVLIRRAGGGLYNFLR